MSEYEFKADENRVVDRFARVARIAGYMDIVLALAIAFVGIRAYLVLGPATILGMADGAAVILSTALLVLFGIWLIRASASMAKIVTTQGSDVSHLMASFGHLTKIYRTQQWIWIVSIALGVVYLLLRLIHFLLTH